MSCHKLVGRNWSKVERNRTNKKKRFRLINSSHRAAATNNNNKKSLPIKTFGGIVSVQQVADK